MSFALMHNPTALSSLPHAPSPMTNPGLEPLPLVPSSIEEATAANSPAERKVLMDLYMRKHHPEIWRSMNEKSRQQKLENASKASEPRMVQQAGGQSKRATNADELIYEWKSYCKEGKNTYIFADPAALATFCDEINGLSCDGNGCRSSNSVVLEYIGDAPNEAREPFTYPVLVATNFDKGPYTYVFNAIEGRLGTQTFPPAYPFRGGDQMREAVPVLAEDCALINKYGSPESCKTFTAGDKVAQIDQFFTEHKTDSGFKGVVFADPQVIEDWGSKSTLLRGGGMITALAVRPKDWRVTKVFIIIGYSVGGIAVAIGSAVIAVKTGCTKKLRDAVSGTVNSMKAAYTAWGQRRAMAQAQASADAGNDDSSIVINSSDSSSGYLGDFSESDSDDETGVGNLNLKS
jgi:hypothetical protein